MNNTDNKIKSGEELIADFFTDISSVENTDRKTVEAIVSVYNAKGKLSERDIQNLLDKQLQEEINKTDTESEQD